VRILGLDIGERRIGVAVSDETGIIARGLETIDRKNEYSAVEKISELIKKYNAEKVVYGMPYKKDGSVGEQGEKTLSFVSQFSDCADVEFIRWDERYSTKEATRTLIKGNVKRKKRKTLKDKLSAIIILQGYLDSATFREERAE